jgi:hypothetical protein
MHRIASAAEEQREHEQVREHAASAAAPPAREARAGREAFGELGDARLVALRAPALTLDSQLAPSSIF